MDIFGEGELKDDIQNRIDNLGLKATVRLRGVADDVRAEYANSSMLVLSSRYEGFGLVLVEAMSCGVPCVAFDCPYGPRDIVRNEEDGILVQHLDVEGLAEGMCRLMEDEALRKSMGQNALHNVSRFSVDNVMQKWVELFCNMKLERT